ncbi:amidohydrolase family protein [Yinghuangia seranimata]|uniref:amidohydrolase family protein n=1 Tax=Yinghuangia seranimata TaxID=408067 RepID=UPI00248C3AA7|nr:amidohydrolase family protein [Yinghuangia seranimata]MDI2130049.1 amidohydrolase family protein [Yinghuangia seranimata]
MLDGHLLVDAHVHAPRLPTLAPAWLRWAHDFGHAHDWPAVYDEDGTVVPALLDAHFAEQGVDHAVLLCEYSPKATGIQPVEDLLPIVKHNPERFRFLGNVNPHLHYPLDAEVERQADLGACGLKLHPVHGGFSCADPMLYPAYAVCRERGLPVVVHCGTSSFPGSTNAYADPVALDTVLRDFPGLTVVLAHGGRGWWYEAAAALAMLHDTVWIELSGLPPRKLPEYYARFNFARLAEKFVFATDWPGMPGTAANARAFAEVASRHGVDDTTLALALGGNAARVYGLGGTH